MSAASGKTVWRSKRQRAAGMALGIFFAFIGVGQFSRPAANGGGTVVAIIALVVGGTLIVIFARAAMVTSDDGVRIRNQLSTVVIPWRDVTGFRIGRHGLKPAVCIVDLTDGSSKYAFGIQEPQWRRAGSQSAERRMIDLLNEMVVTHRGAALQGQ
jgi:hypothetical protein